MEIKDAEVMPPEDALAQAPSLLSNEAEQLLAQIVAEKDEQKSKDLTQLFNRNQNKKTIIRVDKLSNLLDTITDQALTRFTNRPDEISNKELFDGLKVVQDLIERGQKQVSNPVETPLIQVNQQTNEVNINGEADTLSRESRERVKNAVTQLLGNLSTEISVAQMEPVEPSGTTANDQANIIKEEPADD